MANIRLIHCDRPVLEAILVGNDTLADYLKIEVPEPWTEFGLPAFNYALARIQEAPETTQWWTYLPILEGSNTLVGSCGYKGAPSAEGMVEIGYEVARDFRGQGIATEITRLLVERAFQDTRVNTVQAHTLAERNASVRVLEKNRFVRIKEIHDDTDGLIWQWQLPR